MESLSFSGSSKRAKAPSTSSIAQVVHCLVDGCNADLSVCRDYHRRHKVCETHSKTPKVTIGGREQRFCQQCSRFHSLTEFDEGKRSCRKRLDGHNRRRRKPQPDTLARSTSLIFPNQHTLSGTRLLSFSSPHILPNSIVSSWHGLVKPDNNGIGAYVNQHQQMSSPTSHNNTFKGLNQLNSFQDSSLSPIGVDPNSNSSPKIYSEGLNHQVIDSDRALSLLSSQPTRDFSLNHTVVQTEASPHAQSLVNDFNYNGLGPFHHQFSQDSKNVAASSSAEYQQHDSNASTLHFPEMFQHGEGSSASGAHQTLSFMWE